MDVRVGWDGMAGADIYSVDLESIYLFRRGKISKTEDTPEAAVRKSDVIVTGEEAGLESGQPGSQPGGVWYEGGMSSSHGAISWGMAGVPVKDYRLPTAWVKEGAIVVNVSSHKNVDEQEILKVGQGRGA